MTQQGNRIQISALQRERSNHCVNVNFSEWYKIAKQTMRFHATLNVDYAW